MATNIKALDAVGRINLSRVLGKAGHGAEVKRLLREDKDQRAAAVNILGTDTIRDKDIDAARLLYTTLGGQIRPITTADLRQFAHNADQLGKRFKGGITARGVVDASLQVDRERANQQIRTAVVTRAQGGLLHFVTNAGPDSDVNRHHVYVDFPAFASYAASPADPKRLARAMMNGPLKFECDCGRFRYWYRYIATKGKFVHGRLETGFPKIRNPKLVGVACKHALRVMQAVMTDANALAQAAKMIGAAQASSTKAVTMTAADAKAVAAQQLAKSQHLKNQAETSAERAARIAKTPAARARAIQKAAEAAQQRAVAARGKLRKTIDQIKGDLARKFAGTFSDKQLAAMAKAAFENQ